MPSFVPALPAPTAITVTDEAGTTVIRRATQVHGAIYSRDGKLIYQGAFEVAEGLHDDPIGLRSAIIARVTAEQDAYDAQLANTEAARRAAAELAIGHLEF